MSIEITVANAIGGMSGFQLTIEVNDASVAEIVGVAFPNYGEVDLGPPIGFVPLTEVGPLPASSVIIAATDLAGIIEVVVLPKSNEPSHLWDNRPPQGAFIVIEAEDVDQEYRRAVQKGLPIKQKLTDQEWGHRSFSLTEPNGLTLYFFKEIHLAG